MMIEDHLPDPNIEPNLEEWHLHSHKLPLQTFALFPPQSNVVEDPIVAVAIRFKVGDQPFVRHLLKPNRHHDVRNYISKHFGFLADGENSVYGFIHPKTGLFIDREEAMRYALEIGQIRKGFYWDEENYTSLYSEDLWPEERTEDSTN